MIRAFAKRFGARADTEPDAVPMSIPEPFVVLDAARLRRLALAPAAALIGLSGCASLSLPNLLPATAPAAPVNPPMPVAGTAPGGANGQAAAASRGGASAPGAAAGTGSGAPTPAAPAPGQPPAFATVIKDATSTEGLLTVWRKDEKIWLELQPDDLGKTFFLSPKAASGIGERGFYGGLMASTWGLAVGQPQAVQFRRVNNQVQLLALNLAYSAKADSPEAQAVRSAFSQSLLGSAAVASQPHAQKKSILVDASSLFVSDLPGFAQALQRTYRQNYALDARHSAITATRTTPGQLVVEVQNHYATSSIAVPQPGAAPGTPQPTVPATLPDVRSLFMSMSYSLTPLPAQTMAARRADPRLGFFTTTVADFSDDLSRTPKQRFVNRWRLEKKDPAAALSEPVKPITFWLDRSIPDKYRSAIADGILEWNKAFERAGFRDAIRVDVQPADADYDTLDTDRASVRWMTNAGASFGAIGPSHVDPRSGEILDADIAFESLSSRNIRNLRSQVLAGSEASMAALLQPGIADARAAATPMHDPRTCQHADHAAEQLSYALDVLEARGDLDPNGPEARQFVLDYLKDVSMHEVGHTLGLRHNFRASRIYTDAELSDADFTREHGNAGSVMEYSPVNLPAPGQRPATPFQSTLGPYDYWAIEYAYKPLAPADETAELARIAARSAEPALAYGTDEDNFLGVDPEAIQFDLGTDPLVFAKKRIAIARDLFARQEQRPLKPEEDYAVLRRSVAYALRDVARASGVLARQIGGVRTLRDFPGSGRDPLQPVSAARQREALDALAGGVLAADSFRLSPELQRRLAPDFLEREDAVFSDNAVPVATDFSLAQSVLDLQRALLNQLMSDGVAARILDSEPKSARASEAFHLSELYERLAREVWSELGRGDIPALRRELQREHVNRVAALLLRPGAYSRADARSLLRTQAQTLLARLTTAARRGGLSAEARAHLQDSADTLAQALSAKLERTGA